MADISVRYAAMAQGSSGLLATWKRIEQLLADLDAQVAKTHSMEADAITKYQLLKARWNAAAVDRQENLKLLGNYVSDAGVRYRQVDTMLAAQFV